MPKVRRRVTPTVISPPPASTVTPGTTYPIDDGAVFFDSYRNGAFLDYVTAGGSVGRQVSANVSTQLPITMMDASLKVSGIGVDGQWRIDLGTLVDLDKYDAVILGVRDDAATPQIFYFSIQGTNGIRINNFITVTPPAAGPGCPNGLPKRYGGDTVGGFRQIVIPLGSSDTVLTGAPYNGTHGGYGLGMPASGRGMAKYLMFEHNPGGAARNGNTYLDEIRFVRRIQRNMPAYVTASAENGAPLARQLNYVPGVTLDRNTNPPNVTYPDFLPYWTKVVDGMSVNNATIAGTTEEMLEYAARYWGFAPNTTAAYYYQGSRNPNNNGGPPAATGIRGNGAATNLLGLSKAQAAQESQWRPGFPSDWNQYTSDADGQVWTYASWGLGQQKHINWGPKRVPMLWPLFSAMYKGAMLRSIFDGALDYYHGLTPCPTGNIRLALDCYFSGTNPNDASDYVNNILGKTGGSPNGYINDAPWTDKTTPWPWTGTDTI